MKKCYYCGAEIDDDADFCTECGNELPDCTCPQCGADVRDEDNFCQNCGYDLLNDEGVEVDDKSCDGVVDTLEEVEESPKSKIIIPIVIGIIALALIGGWYFFGSNSSQEDKDTQPLVTDSISVDSDTTEGDAMSPEQVIEEKKQFLESFYKKYDSLDEYDEAFIKSIVTNNALQILKKHYTKDEGGDMEDPNGLACWLFNYYNGWVACGSVISRNITSKGGDMFVVTAKYEDEEKYEVELSVIKDGDSYKIDDINPIGSDMSDDESEIKSQEELARTNTAIGAFDVRDDSIQ